MIAVNPGWDPRICILKLTDDSDDGKHCVCNKKKLEWDLIMESFKKLRIYCSPRLCLAPPELLDCAFKTNCQVKEILRESPRGILEISQS